MSIAALIIAALSAQLATKPNTETMSAVDYAGQAAPSERARSGITGPASSLVGLTEAQVRSRLGEPSEKEDKGGGSFVLLFDCSVGPIRTLSVFFNRRGVVSQVSDADFELGMLTAKTPAERLAFGEAMSAKFVADAEAEVAAAPARAAAARARAESERKRKEAEPLVRVNEAQARGILAEAGAIAKNDVGVFDKEFRSRVARIAPDFQGPRFVIDSPALSIIISGPLGAFFSEARERVRKFEPLAPPPTWPPEIQLIVNPKQINAPDIEKVVVQRNGNIVPAIRTTLAPRQMVTAMGAKSMIRAGVVTYPLSAFEPGAGVMVTVIAIPASGSNITHAFDSLELRTIQ